MCIFSIDMCSINNWPCYLIQYYLLIRMICAHWWKLSFINAYLSSLFSCTCLKMTCKIFLFYFENGVVYFLLGNFIVLLHYLFYSLSIRKRMISILIFNFFHLFIKLLLKYFRILHLCLCFNFALPLILLIEES